ncbi:DUF3006 family protein [Salinilacihabitans rarus]|uniref:DUF3006 family protein n=1 Tax=Salinilacihabitans rarus TaxID=2961596 RepID=UPI0020C89B65|nr:DUF3006 family protein [Salinilacihabitans rarus]
MSRTASTRRTALRTLASLLAAALALPAAAGVRAEAATPPCERLERGAEPTLGAGRANRPRTSVAVVDRVVDGEHVVLLLEADGEVVDQLVVPREDLPDVEDGDVLLVTVEDGDLVDAAPLDRETARRRRWRRRRLECLRERP